MLYGILECCFVYARFGLIFLAPLYFFGNFKIVLSGILTTCICAVHLAIFKLYFDWQRLEVKVPVTIQPPPALVILSDVTIDIERRKNRLLKCCYVPATSAAHNKLLFLLRPFTVLTKQSKHAPLSSLYS
jgi:hypothetical protein